MSSPTENINVKNVILASNCNISSICSYSESIENIEKGSDNALLSTCQYANTHDHAKKGTVINDN